MRALALLAVAGLACALVSGVIRSQLPLSTTHGLRSKFETWRAHRDDYDILYVGSSALYRGIRPNVIDPMLSQHGHRIRSFNLALPGMFSFETDAFLGRILDDAPPDLDLIVLEFPRWNAKRAAWETNVNTIRSVAWHTPRQTRNVLVSAWLEPSYDGRERLSVASTHLGLFARWQGNVGLGGPLLGQNFHAPELHEGTAPLQLLASGGWVPLEIYTRRDMRRRQTKFLESAPEWEKAVARRTRRAQENAGPRSLAGYNEAALRAQVDRIRRAGQRVVYLVPPLNADLPAAEAMARRGVIPDLIDTNRPDLHPELFAVENRFDINHLNANGAKIFSQLLAREIALRLRGENVPPRGAAP